METHLHEYLVAMIVFFSFGYDHGLGQAYLVDNVPNNIFPILLLFIWFDALYNLYCNLNYSI